MLEFTSYSIHGIDLHEIQIEQKQILCVHKKIDNSPINVK